MPVPPSERPHEWIVRQLRNAILEGVHEPGDKLPVERELSETFGVSRSAVRQALLVLDQQGLVRVKPGVGGGPFVVCEPMPAAVTALENVLTIEKSSVAEFVQAKLAIEPAIARYAAQRLSAEARQRLEDNLERTRCAIDLGEDATELAVEFHLILMGSTGNRFIDAIFEVMTRSFSRIPAESLATADQNCVVDDHRSIIDALRSDDHDKVGRLMADHVGRVWSQQAVSPSPRLA